MSSPSKQIRRPLQAAGLALFTLLAACDSGGGSSTPPAIGIADDPVVGSNDVLPGVVVVIEGVRGGAVADRAEVGQRLTVDFTVQTADGRPLELANMTRGAIMVSGPTFNYQRVIPSQGDVLTASVKRAVGAYRYTFSQPIPATYVAPLNDTELLSEGELTGQALLSGTYTVGIELRKDYTVDGVVYRDPGNTTRDFLIGSADTVDPREVVTLANCNRCHGELRAHGDNRNNLTNCLLCHTSGAEDRNTAGVANGTPGVAIDFKVMIHKLHNAAHLPSVNGVATNPDGSRNYAAAPRPYEIMGFGNNVTDFSHVTWPAWPTFASGMPRDIGYNALGNDQKAQENAILTGVTDCAKCHGDPDGAGPLPAPAQGDLAYTQPSVAACASCHDDWNPDQLYSANGLTMPIERDNAACKNCHRPEGTQLDVRDAHRHPLTDPVVVNGLHFELQAVEDVPAAGGTGNGRFDAGEHVRITMRILDGAGTDVPAAALDRLEMVLNGPTTNPNMVNYMNVPPAGLGGGPIYTFDMPQLRRFEPVGLSFSGMQMFGTAQAPHWNVANTDAATALRLATGVTFGTQLASAAPANQNYVDLLPGQGANFAKNDFIALDLYDAARREYMRVQWREGDRLWFSTINSQKDYAASLRFTHPANATVDRVAVESIPTSKYTLDATTGLITETSEFGLGEVLVDYCAPFVVPETYPGALNDTPGLDQGWGDWGGLPILSGTYHLGLYGEDGRSVTVAAGGASQATTYVEVTSPLVVPLLFGSATKVTEVARIENADGCYRCHNDIQFHGNHRRGVDTCLLCHGLAGAEDWPQYLSPNGIATPGVTIDFRTMLHKIHSGKELAEGADYVVAGRNASPSTYEEIGFPFMPGETSNCTSCHGASDAWVEPAPRSHPQATLPTRVWRAACGACHDSEAQQAHIDANTSPSGAEACSICHGQGKEYDVRTAHTVK